MGRITSYYIRSATDGSVTDDSFLAGGHGQAANVIVNKEAGKSASVPYIREG